MKPFSKPEAISVIVIFLLLFAVSIPNFMLSLTRSRDQIRRDDLGSLQHALDLYYADFKEFPLSTDDGKLIACKNPEDEAFIDEKGKLNVNLIPCEWGQDSLQNFTPGGEEVYINIIPGDPQGQKGVGYRYISDGNMYQLFISLEEEGGIELDPKISARNLMCGVRVCNAGRSYACPTDKSFEMCREEFLKPKK